MISIRFFAGLLSFLGRTRVQRIGSGGPAAARR
jgi:hypothetical protein